MAACVFRTNPLKCVPMCVPMMKCSVPMAMRMCALDPFQNGGEITFIMGTHGGQVA